MRAQQTQAKTPSPRDCLLVVDACDGDAIAEACRRAGYTTVTAADSTDGLRLLYEHRPDAVLLDLELGGHEGWHVLERIRELTDVPLLLLVARHSGTETVRALHAGADDVVTKPVDVDELLARLGALLRRRHWVAPPIDGYVDGRVDIDVPTRRVVTDGRKRDLTPTEFRLLEALVRHADMVLTPAQLLELVWFDPIGVSDGSVKNAVLRLRRKLGWDDLATSPIVTVRGIGYRYQSRATS